jgi:photosystem II stability/assembly factor-like uncharacterized protein
MSRGCNVEVSVVHRRQPVASGRLGAGFCMLLLICLSAAPLAADVGRWSAIGPYGGAVAALAVDPIHPNVIYALAGAGIFKSTDGASTWAQINHGLPLGFQARALAVDPLQPTTLYAGGFSFGVYKSVDGGDSWTPPGSGLQGPRSLVFSLAVDPRHSGTVYAGTQPGLDKTTDGGATWAPAQNGIPGGTTISALAVAPSSPSTVYAGTGVGDLGIYKTTDGGLSWAPGGPEPLGTVLAVDPSNAQIVYAGSPGGVFKTTDGGKTWNASNTGMGHVQVSALVIAPSNSRILYAGTNTGVYASKDSGASWTSASQGLIDLQILALAVDPSTASTAYSGSASRTAGLGAFKTANGGASWSASYPTGLSALGPVSFAVNPLTPATIYANVDAGLLMTVNGGATWSPASGLTGAIGSIAQDPSAPSTLYATETLCGGAPPVRLCRSLDGGATWSPIATPVTPNAIAVDPTLSTDLYITGGNDVWRSTNGGATWTPATGELSQALLDGIVTDARSPGTLYVFGEIPNGPNFNPPPQARLYKSVDRGVTWTQIQGGLSGGNPDQSFVEALVIDPATSTLYAVAGNEVQKSADGGATWSVIYPPPGSASPAPTGLAIAPGQPSTLYVQLEGSILATSDEGATFQPITAPGLAGAISQLTVDPQNPQHLLAAGIQSLTLSPPPACAPGPTALCLGGGRFKVEATWATAQTSGAGQAVSLTPDTGYFWFFAAGNLELVVKVLDGCALNGDYWVFAGGLTNVQVSLRVTDSQSGNVEIYTNPGGVAFPPIQDTGAFLTCP